MSEEKIKELLNSLFEVKYRSSNYNFNAIQEESRATIETIIRSFLLDNRDEKLGVLEAKVKFYEEMISKSTFAPMLVKDEKVVEEITEPEPYHREMLFTQRQIEHLQNKVFQITGEGEVMQLFNELLCVNAG